MGRKGGPLYIKLEVDFELDRHVPLGRMRLAGRRQCLVKTF